MWWLRRSISKTSVSACRSACAAAIPAKPPPMMTTRFRSGRGASTTAMASLGRVSANIALMDHLVRSFFGMMTSAVPFRETALSTGQPLGLARASRHKNRLEGAGSPRHGHLVGHPLIGAHRRLRREQIRSNVYVLVGGSCRRLGIGLVESAERIQPQQGP